MEMLLTLVLVSIILFSVLISALLFTILRTMVVTAEKNEAWYKRILLYIKEVSENTLNEIE